MHLHEVAQWKCLVSLNWLRFLDLGSYLILAVVAGVHWHSDQHHWIGAALSVPAFLLWMLARQQIGASFAVRAEAKKLVIHGLYSKIRHPIYIFGGLAFHRRILGPGLVPLDGGFPADQL